MGKNGSKVQKCSRNRGGNDLKRKNIPIFGAKMAIKGKTIEICRGNMSRKRKIFEAKKKSKKRQNSPIFAGETTTTGKEKSISGGKLAQNVKKCQYLG